jgi:hypothetical protein
MRTREGWWWWFLMERGKPLTLLITLTGGRVAALVVGFEGGDVAFPCGVDADGGRHGEALALGEVLQFPGLEIGCVAELVPGVP